MVITTTPANEPELVETGEKRDVLGRRHTPAERRTECCWRRIGPAD